MQEPLNGIDVYFERRGSGPRLLFFNGSGASIASTGPLIDILATRFEVLVHDQRGIGRTQVPDEPSSMADFAADAAALLDHVGWSTCRVLGVSFGGMVAQEFAVTWPERVDRLVLACTSSGGAGGASYPLHELANLPPDEQIDVGLRILDKRFTPEWLASHPKDQSLVEMMASRRNTPKSDTQARGEAAQLQARSGHDVWDRLGMIICPTLVAGGRFDGIAPPENSEAIASRIPNVTLRLYDGGHIFFMQDPSAFPEIMDFLADDVT
jgi:3-oxoadipate enol-lactonase